MYAGETRRAPLAERAAAPLQVFLLGRFEVIRGEAPIPAHAWRRRRPADLLKLIALAPGRQLPRDEVIEALWPDKDAGNGANNLHRALYDLRQILGARWVDLDHGRVSLSEKVWLDVEAFEHSAASTDPADRAAAAALYRGDLCPDDPDCSWMSPQRRRFRETLTSLALPLAREAAERGDGPVAMPLLRQVLAIVPHHEEAHALLMRLLAQAGRRADALRQYDACEAALRSNGLPPPNTDLRALRDAIQRGDLGPARAPAAYDGFRRAARRLLGTADPAPLRGRTSSLLLFESLVERGSGSLVLLGERGVGTSRLAIEGARIAQEAGAVVLCGTFEAALGVPSSCFSDLFAQYFRAGGTAGQDPFTYCAPAGAASPGGMARLLDAVRTELTRIGGGRPLYVLIEDLHLADESSANLFHFLARAAGAMRLMLVATCREDALHAGTPAQMLLSHLDCERLARGIRVQRLDLAASRQQLGDLIGTEPGDALALRFYRLTDGSPFYTEELARAFKESGHVEVPGDPVAAVRERVGRLGRRAVALLEAGAVMGRRFDLDVVLPATGLSAHDSLVVLDEVMEARIVDDDGTGQRFHHSLVRDAIYDGLSPHRRATLHRAIADAIEERAARTPLGIEHASAQLAHHRRAGNQPDRAFAHFVTAGHRAGEHAGLREACAFYEAALALADASGASGPQRLELLDGLGRVQLALAELPGALRTFDASVSLTDKTGWRPGPELRARARRQSALALLVAGRFDEARQQLERGLADALLGPGDERAELLYLVALLAWHDGHLDDALDAARRCTVEARRVGDAELTTRARDLAHLAGAPADEPPVIPWRGPSTSRSQDTSSDIHLILWQNQLLGDRPASTIEAAVAAFRERSGRRDWQPGAAVARAVEGALAARSGRYEPAELALRDAQELFRRDGSAFGEAFTLETLGRLHTSRGHVDEALALLGEGMLVAERAQLRRHALLGMHAALARNRLAAGALYAAEDAVAEASVLATRHGDCAVCHALFRPEMIRVHLARGRIEQAEAELREFEELARRSGGQALRASTRLARGRVLLAQGRHAGAATLFLEAATAWEQLGHLCDAARSMAAAASALQAGDLHDRQAEADALAQRASDVLGPTSMSDA